MTKQRNIKLRMPDGGQAGYMEVWYDGDESHVEFRGRPYTQWDGVTVCDFQRVHDALEGWHACVLHTNQILTLLPSHPDYAAVEQLMKESE